MGSTKDEKRSGKRKSREDKAVEDAPVARSDKPKKRRTSESLVTAEPVVNATNDSDEPAKKSKKKRKPDEEAVAGTTADLPKKKSRKFHNEGVDTPGAVEEAHAESAQNHKKNKKRKDNGNLDEPPTNDKKSKSKYPNPAKDESLDEHVQKGLAYAYAYVRKKDWKFSKARQNWLMKHVYDPALVPDAYLDVVLEYLKSVKGQALKHMHETCTTLSTAASETTTSQSSAEADLTATRSSRAMALLSVLPDLPVESTE